MCRLVLHVTVQSCTESRVIRTGEEKRRGEERVGRERHIYVFLLARVNNHIHNTLPGNSNGPNISLELHFVLLKLWTAINLSRIFSPGLPGRCITPELVYRVLDDLRKRGHTTVLHLFQA